MELTRTGIIRHLDDLGRIVVPKELRRTLGVREGDPMEVYLTPDGHGVVFRKPELTPAEELFTALENTLEMLGEHEAAQQVHSLAAAYRESIHEKEEDTP